MAKYHANLGEGRVNYLIIKCIHIIIILYTSIGVIYHMEKKYGLAEKSYETALQLEPSLTTAKDNMKKLHSTLSKRSKS